jgi:cellulose synthase/poly-beta-1,6-N-acetylglucosamine synthase-like glycosyltransferase
MFVVYRRRAVLEAGGIVEGMNGEDTDICLRMSSQGYLNMAEPTAVYFSEVPQTWAHLREQRVRGSAASITSRAQPAAMLDRSSMAGVAVLPSSWPTRRGAR